MSLGLAARYEQLEQVERELSRTERELLDAHMKLNGPGGARPEQLYTEVLGLRARLRQMMVRLGDEFVGAPGVSP